jgi:hypothetical protein
LPVARFADYTARLTLDITPAMRARIKVSAFTQGVTVAELLRALLEREFPEKTPSTHPLLRLLLRRRPAYRLSTLSNASTCKGLGDLGFGAEVKDALRERADFLAEQGLARASRPERRACA